MFLILFFWDSKWPLLQILALGLSLSGLYLVPTAALQGTYSAYDTHRLEGDLWTLLFRYPWIDLLRAVARADLSLLATLDPVHLTTPLAAAYLLCSKAVRINRPLAGTVTLILVATISSSSPFIVASLPLAIHYYRYFGFLFILSTLVLVGVSQTLLALSPTADTKLQTSTCWSILVADHQRFIRCAPPATSIREKQSRYPLLRERRQGIGVFSCTKSGEITFSSLCRTA